MPKKEKSPKGASPIKLKGSLKRSLSQDKKDLKLVVKREFLNLGAPVYGLNFQ